MFCTSSTFVVLVHWCNVIQKDISLNSGTFFQFFSKNNNCLDPWKSHAMSIRLQRVAWEWTEKWAGETSCSEWRGNFKTDKWIKKLGYLEFKLSLYISMFCSCGTNSDFPYILAKQSVRVCRAMAKHSFDPYLYS